MSNHTATKFIDCAYRFNFRRNDETGVIVVSNQQGHAIDMFIEDGHLDTIAQQWIEDFTDETGANLFR